MKEAFDPAAANIKFDWLFITATTCAALFDIFQLALHVIGIGEKEQNL